MPGARPPVGVEVQYAAALRVYLGRMRHLVRHYLEPKLDQIFAESRALAKGDDETRIDDYGATIKSAFGTIRVMFYRDTAGAPEHAATSTAHAVAADNKERNGKLYEVVARRRLVPVDVLKSEPWLPSMVDLFVSSNVSLIKSIPDQYLSQVETIVRQAAAGGQRPESLEDEIAERYDVAESRAKLIARDQVSKYNGELNRVRQTRLGVQSYIWRTSEDERVRESHKAKDGREFAWDDPPADTGAPGMDFQCRCWPDPQLDSLDDSDTAEGQSDDER